GILCVQGAGEDLPFREGSFDLALIVVSICFVKDPFGVLKECRRVLTEEGKLLLGLIPRESRWAEFYMCKGEAGHPIYRHAKFHPLKEIEDMLLQAGFRIDSLKSTLLEDPQDERPIKNRETLEGFNELAGFTCIRAFKRVLPA
ncbi:class I SAM-dependent methyltransferase, partial [Hydrogenivirga sp.]